MADEDKKFIYDYLHKNHFCVLATVNGEGQPEAATMAFSETVDLEIIFQTPNFYRKYANLKSNPKVAITVGWDINEFDTVQYEGIARELEDEEEIEKYRQIHVKKNPSSEKYAYILENKYFLVKPTWIRYMDMKTEPPKLLSLGAATLKMK